MEYIIENLTKREIDIMESSDIEWCPDDISSDSTDIVVFNKKDLDKTLYLIGSICATYPMPDFLS